MGRGRRVGKGKGRERCYSGSKGPRVGEEDPPLSECPVMGCQGVRVGSVLPGIGIPRDGKALVAKSEPVVKAKESWERGSLDQWRGLGVVMRKARTEDLVLGFLEVALSSRGTEGTMIQSQKP